MRPANEHDERWRDAKVFRQRSYAGGVCSAVDGTFAHAQQQCVGLLLDADEPRSRLYGDVDAFHGAGVGTGAKYTSPDA